MRNKFTGICANWEYVGEFVGRLAEEPPVMSSEQSGRGGIV